MFTEYDRLKQLMSQSESRLEKLSRTGLATGTEAFYRRKADEHFRKVTGALRNGDGQLSMALAGYYLLLAESERGNLIDA